MKVIETELPGVVIIQPDVFQDARGFFVETWNQRRYQQTGLAATFVQDNLSFSTRGVLRGLHFQHPHQQAKLVYVLQGEVFDVAVDIRRGSPTFGWWVGRTLSSDHHLQMYVPEGFAHGFCVTSEAALFVYKCTDFYHRHMEMSIRWDDPEIGIAWPIQTPELSERDAAAPCLKEMAVDRLPQFEQK
ncbi:MAG: dTDP-4-dehydrorhamnose 3,5-epimerase [Acidobacteria bacterium]|nr:dTDP-4-dehydrorhamnose 3,5-epimerase [Acidobacteriota bacterium]